MSETIVIAGAGHAAGQAAASLRQKKFAGRIIMVGDEAYVPYQRPPLSKKYLAGEMETKRLYFKPENFYPDHDIELRLSTRVESLDTAAKTVRLDSGDSLEYSKLLLTTGSRVRKLAIPGSDLPGIHYLRNIDDVLSIQKDFAEGARLVIVGAGYIGLEVAAIAVKRGIEVTVLETEGRAMNRVVAPEISEFFQELHSAAGVKIEFGRMVQEFRGDGKIEQVVCADGYTVPADICIVGIGILPNSELAEEAGLSCNNGIVVDEFARTSEPDIYAAGDCTYHPNALLGVSLRLESVHNALEQAKTAAAAMCGELTPYAQIPWFWSDQYDVKLQIVGLSQGYDQLVIRGDKAAHSFAAFYLQNGRLLAVDAINSPREFMLAKKLVAAKAVFDPQQLADEALDFKTMATAALEAAQQ
ncbi:MAG: FAD-dependent oxidoreductase [Gammaproteobacteria bacterium]|jgi:3-phenylpropionate/trans-cinnamate dioxygenase ferredoxin reductase subunit